MKLFLVSSIVLILASCKQWEVPAALVGKWECKQKVTVRDKQNGNYVFIDAPDSLLLQFSIDENGKVNGHLGDAAFANCRLLKNRNALGKKLNLATDFVIKGNLDGPIFPNDPHAYKKISAPFDVKNNKMEGSLFQLFGLDLYPMTGFDAVKQKE